MSAFSGSLASILGGAGGGGGGAGGASLASLLALLGGGGLSGLGGLVGGMAPGRPAREARSAADQRYRWQQDPLLRAFYGDQGQAVDPATGQIGAAYRPQTGILQQGRNTTRQLGSRFQDIGRDFDRGSRDLMTGARGLEGMASAFGVGAESLIDDEMARGLAGANRQTSAANAARGFGASTLVANQQAANARNFARAGAQQKVGLRQQTLDRRLGARQYATDLGSRFLTQGTAMREGQARTMADMRRTNTGIEAGLWSGPSMQPYSGLSYAPSPSQYGGMASAIGSTGNALAGLGSLFLMQDLFGRRGG